LTAKGGGGIILAGNARLSGICRARGITPKDSAITWEATVEDPEWPAQPGKTNLMTRNLATDAQRDSPRAVALRRHRSPAYDLAHAGRLTRVNSAEGRMPLGAPGGDRN
jgi:hypothetical protein